MTHRFSDLMFTQRVKQLQEADGSRSSYARFEDANFPARDQLTSKETEFIALRDSFYMATVSETGWPYVQHRGGRAGFLKTIDKRTLAFPEFPGNRQFVSFGNISGGDRVALILMDYPKRQRLKILGHAKLVESGSDPHASIWMDGASSDDVQRGIVIRIEGFDWNCPQYITPRFTETELAPLRDRLAALEAENKELRARIR